MSKIKNILKRRVRSTLERGIRRASFIGANQLKYGDCAITGCGAEFRSTGHLGCDQHRCDRHHRRLVSAK